VPEYGDSIHASLIAIGVAIVAANVLLLAFCKWRQSKGDSKAVVEMEVNQAV